VADAKPTAFSGNGKENAKFVSRKPTLRGIYSAEISGANEGPTRYAGEAGAASVTRPIHR